MKIDLLTVDFMKSSSCKKIITWELISPKCVHTSRIKVAVVKGDYADLCGLGLPLSLSLQL